jgi:ribosome-associated translation inhibitor RaiA
MRVQVNSDRGVDVSEALAREITGTLDDAMRLFRNEITRIEVHLGDANAGKSGPDDKRCLLEARLAGLDPITVDHRASEVPLAIAGAVGKLQRALESRLGKLRAR